PAGLALARTARAGAGAVLAQSFQEIFANQLGKQFPPPASQPGTGPWFCHLNFPYCPLGLGAAGKWWRQSIGASRCPGWGWGVQGGWQGCCQLPEVPVLQHRSRPADG
uniref:Uncharacterized protein n=1 Tax=Corvus moneduloides TaxID=1196302 RepID=A0A8C3DTS8_CORMO